MKPIFTSVAHVSVGVLLSAASAVSLAVAAERFGYRAWLPWVFIAILVALSARYGAMVSLLGSVVAIIVFARRVYDPVGSVAIADVSAKENLAWMALIAISASYLLFPQEKSHR